MFFASASDDHTVRIWDCQRLEKNVTNRSRLTYSQLPGKLTCLTILEGTHSVGVGSDTGCVHVFRVDHAPKKDTGFMRYSSISTVKTIEPGEGAIIGIDHFNIGEAQSLLVYGTRFEIPGNQVEDF